MLKILIQLFILYALLQYVFKVDVNKMVIPYLEPVIEVFEGNNLTLDSLSVSLLDGDISSILDNVNLDQLQNMLEGQDLESLLQDKNLTAEDAKAKIEQMKAQLQQKLELLEDQ